MITLFIIKAMLSSIVVGACVVVGAIMLIAALAGAYDPYKGIEKEQETIQSIKKKKSKEHRGFTEEEILALGLHPNDEAYKMYLISEILDK